MAPPARRPRTLCFAFVPLIWALAQLDSARPDARGVPVPLCAGLVAANQVVAFSCLYFYYISYVACCFGWRQARTGILYKIAYARRPGRKDGDASVRG